MVGWRDRWESGRAGKHGEQWNEKVLQEEQVKIDWEREEEEEELSHPSQPPCAHENSPWETG